MFAVPEVGPGLIVTSALMMINMFMVQEEVRNFSAGLFAAFNVAFSTCVCYKVMEIIFVWKELCKCYKAEAVIDLGVSSSSSLDSLFLFPWT